MKTKTFVIVALSSASLLSAVQTQPQQQQNSNTNSNSSQYQYNANFKQTPRTIMDDEIARNVHTVLAANWISSGYPHVTFDVNNATVNLRGFVETQEDKNKVEQAVKKLEGVKNVNSEIRVGLNQTTKTLALNTSTQPKTTSATPSTVTPTTTTTKDTGTTENDRLINTKIREKISSHSPRGYETIVIATSNGAVTVTGFVERVEDIQKISSDAKSVSGVKSVTNKISIKKQ